MRHLVFPLCLAAAIGATAVAQTPEVQHLGIGTPISDVRSDWFDNGIESPNGRFYIVTSFVGDSGFFRYDRVKKNWAHLSAPSGEWPEWSPNGRFLAFIRNSPELHAWHVWVVPIDTATGLTSGAARRVTTHAVPRSNRPFDWSPDGRHIAYVRGDTTGAAVAIAPFNGGDESVLYRAPGSVAAIAWSPDGRYVYLNHGEKRGDVRETLRIAVADKRVESLGRAQSMILGVSPDGRWLAEFNRLITGQQLYLVPTDKANKVRRFWAPVDISGWSHTQPNALVGMYHPVPSTIQRIALPGGAIRDISPLDSNGNGGPALSADGRKLAYLDHTLAGSALVISDADGSHPQTVAQGDIRDLEWSPAGQPTVAYMIGNAIHLAGVGDKARELLSPEQPECPRRVVNCIGRQLLFQWRNDGKAIRYFERKKVGGRPVLELHEVDLNGKQHLIVSANLDGAAHFIAGTDTLFAVTPRKGLYIVDTKGGQVRQLSTHVLRVDAPIIPRRGDLIATVQENDPVNGQTNELPLTLSLATGEAHTYSYGLHSEISTVYFHPDGRDFILSACPTCDAGIEKWSVVLLPMNGDTPRILTSGSDANFADFGEPVVSPDGRSVYVEAEHSYNTRLVTISLPRP